MEVGSSQLLQQQHDVVCLDLHSVQNSLYTLADIQCYGPNKRVAFTSFVETFFNHLSTLFRRSNATLRELQTQQSLSQRYRTDITAKQEQIAQLSEDLAQSRAETTFVRGQVERRSKQLSKERAHYDAQLVRVREAALSGGLGLPASKLIFSDYRKFDNADSEFDDHGFSAVASKKQELSTASEVSTSPYAFLYCLAALCSN